MCIYETNDEYGTYSVSYTHLSVGEEENLYVPPSTALAGKIYGTLMAQVVAGKKFGGLNEVESVRFDLKRSEISELERIGLRCV